MQYPTGTVTFLFTDIEGSTRLALEHPESFETMRHRHHEILYKAMEAYNGFVFQIIGDAFCVAFHTAGEALRAALQAQTDLLAEQWNQSTIRVRMGIHTGQAEVQAGSEYQGYLTLSRVQRVMSVAHGRQVLLSNTSYELIRGELPEGISLLDLKEHRLKGLLNPEHLWQAVTSGLPRDFPPLQTLNDIPNNLPIQLTSFIGRENEIAELVQQVNDHLLVTLTGSGGVGKTRLSLQVAAEVLDLFPDGVWFLELAPITDPALVPSALAKLLGLRESSESKQSINDLICNYLQSRKVLLILDNCEHLIDACAHLVDQVLRKCKQVKVLASSREALGVAGEMAWHVPSLSLPDQDHLPSPEQLSQYAAVRLFIDRATLIQPHFQVSKENAPAIAQVCARLDGIPLALELAAARVNVLSIEQISKRLDDRFRLLTGGSRTALPRQQTLRAMIDWSYNLLSEQESLLFRRLSVFVGGWSLEAAEAVCAGDGLEADLVLDLLSQLVNKSLISMTEEEGECRYHRLETIRQYTREKLFATDEAARIRDKHLDYFIQLGEQGFEELLGPFDLVWINKLELDNDNFRAALNWSLESPDLDPQKALQLSGALQDFWDTRGYTSEGYQWLTEALKKAPEEPTSFRCRAILGATLMCIRLSRYKVAETTSQESLVMARQLGIVPLTIRSLIYFATTTQDMIESKKLHKEAIELSRKSPGQPQLAWALGIWALWYSKDVLEVDLYIKEAYEIAQKKGNAREKAMVILQYGGIEMRRNHFESAINLLQECLGLFKCLKEKHYTAHSLLILGRVATRQADFAAASKFEEEALQTLKDLSDRGCSVECLFHLGWNAFLSGELDQADHFFQTSLSICREFDLVDLSEISNFGLGRLAVFKKDFQSAKSYFLQTLQTNNRSIASSHYFLTYCLEAVCSVPGLKPETTAQILGGVQTIRDQKGYFLSEPEHRLVDPLFEELRKQLGKVAFESEFAAGKTLTSEQITDLAIEELQAVDF